jgi:hypothetical protein
MHAVQDQGRRAPADCLALVESAVSDGEGGEHKARYGDETMTKIQRVIAAGLTGIYAGLVLSAAPAAAQTAKPPAQIKITNMRAAPLTTFEIATPGEQSRLVGKLDKPLAPGKSASVKLTKPAGCTYLVLAKFSDDAESDAESMDLCRDRVIRLTE